MFMALPRWRGGRARGFSRTRRSVSIDASGIRKRIVTPSARLRASHIVLAGNIHLGAPLRRLSETLLPVWRYAAVTAPLGERLAEAIDVQGFGDRQRRHRSFPDRGRRPADVGFSRKPPGQRGRSVLPAPLQRRIRTIFPQLGKVEIAEVWGGAIGQTVHGMPQIGQLRRGLWVASGFGRQGLNTSAMAGQLIARSILRGDDRWRLFSPFELVWAGGPAGRVAGQPWACGGGEVLQPPARWPAIGSGRGPGSVFAKRAWPRPIGRPERRRGAVRRRAGRIPNVRRRSRQIPSKSKARAGNRAFQPSPRKKVRKLRRTGVTSGAKPSYLRPNTANLALHGDHHDRPPYPARIRRQPVWPCRFPLVAGHAGPVPPRNSRSKRPMRNGARS